MPTRFCNSWHRRGGGGGGGSSPMPWPYGHTFPPPSPHHKSTQGKWEVILYCCYQTSAIQGEMSGNTVADPVRS